MTDRGRVPALDGLRGVAILGVLAYHGGWLPGGQHGVDVFFVLSGYLITGLLLAEPPLRTFYRRRVARLAPALLAALLVASLVLLAHGQAGQALTVALGGGLYVGNYLSWLQPFGLSLGMMGVLWSLAVEEQFYLLWPLLLRRLRRPLPVVSGLFAASTLWRIVLVAQGHTAHVYFGTDTRAAALLLGALVALWKPRLTMPGPTAAVAAVGVVAALAVQAERPFAFLLAMTVAECSTALLVVALTAPSATRTALESRPLVACGRVSYGLYLYANVTLLLLGHQAWEPLSARMIALWLPLTFAVAFASFRWLEQPARRRLLAQGGVRGDTRTAQNAVVDGDLIDDAGEHLAGAAPAVLVRDAQARVSWGAERAAEPSGVV